MDKNIFWNCNKLMGYNGFLNFIIGERGVGKTYQMKTWCVKHWKKTGKKFVYIRRYKTELEEGVGDKHTNKFFGQIQSEFPDDKFEIKGSNENYTFLCNGEVCGYGMPLSISNILKGTSYNDVDVILFDEFMIDKGAYRYLKNEVEMFLDLIETLARLRDINVYMLSNNISISNPYFDFFNIHIPYNSEFATYKDGLIVVEYIKNEKYREAKRNSKFGRLISGTKYGDYAIDNQSLRDNSSFISKRPSGSKLLCNLTVKGLFYGVWYFGEILYLSKDYDGNYPVSISLDVESHNENTELENRSGMLYKLLLNKFRVGAVYFEQQNIKNNVIEYLTYGLK